MFAAPTQGRTPVQSAVQARLPIRQAIDIAEQSFDVEADFYCAGAAEYKDKNQLSAKHI